MNNNGTILLFQTLCLLTPSEFNSTTELEKRKAFNTSIRRRYSDSVNDLGDDPFVETEGTRKYVVNDEHDLYEDLKENGNDSTAPEADVYGDVETYDKFLNAEVLLPRENEKNQLGKVIRRTVNEDCNEIGSYHNQPILDTRIYDAMFPDGSVEQYAANTISEYIYSSVDVEGYRYLLLENIVDHKRTKDATEIEDSNSKNKITTKVWYLLVRWRDGSESWKPLKDMKESCPVEVALYAEANNLIAIPAFKWWVPYTLKKRMRIISAIKSRMRQKSHKYGIQVPQSVVEAYRLDRMLDGDDYWAKTIQKEMKNVSISFDYVEKEEMYRQVILSCYLAN